MTQNPHAIYFPDIEPNGEPKVRLKRIGPGRFELLEKFRYLDHKFGMIEIQPFETDLTTVHFWNSWITEARRAHARGAGSRRHDRRPCVRRHGKSRHGDRRR